MTHKYSTKDKILNWLHYHIWYLVAAGLLLTIGGSMIANKTMQARKNCDYCIAYVGTFELPAECVGALKSEIAALGVDTDGDGEVTVKINQYIISETTDQNEEVSYGRVAEMALLTDITKGESYFFLAEYPEEFQQDFQLMAHMDGSPSADEDFGVWDKVYRWADCPVPASLELGASTDAAGAQIDHQQLMANLWLGRRCFIDPGMGINSQPNADLWAILTANAVPPQPAE